MKFTKNFSNPNLYKLYNNNKSESFDFLMNNIHDNYFSNLLSNVGDGVFNAVCLSGFTTEVNTGTAPSITSAIIDDVEKRFYIIVRPLNNLGNILPDPRNFVNTEEIEEVISMHKNVFLARSNFSINGTPENPISFGQIIQCKFKEGSVSRSDFRGLTFDNPTYIDYEESYRHLGIQLGAVTAEEAILNGKPIVYGSRITNAVGNLNSAESILKQIEEGEFTNVDNIMKKFANEFPAMPEGTIGGSGIDPEIFKRSVEAQLAFWKGKGESDPTVYPMLKAYYDNAKFGSNWTPTGTPWSAVFVSFQLQAYNFKAGASHYKYTCHVKNGNSPGWSNYSLTKTKENYVDVGDVLVYGRASGPPGSKNYTKTHGDVVYKIEGDTAYLAGGNVGNTAQTKKIKVDSSRKILDLKNDKNNVYLIILKKTDGLTGLEDSSSLEEDVYATSEPETSPNDGA